MCGPPALVDGCAWPSPRQALRNPRSTASVSTSDEKLVTLATIAFWAIFALALARAPEPVATTSPAPGTAPSDAVRPKSLTAAEVAAP